MLEILFSLLTLIVLEAILGIDNLVFIAILSSRLPANRQKQARGIGLMLAWIMRLLLLAGIFWMMGLTKPIFRLFQFEISWHDLFLMGGGVFLLAKGTREIHTEIALAGKTLDVKPQSRYWTVILQIVVFDLIFSLDSIFTAVGLTHRYWIMAAAITVAILLMLLASTPLTRLINRHPTFKMLALSFLLLIGTVLIADGLHFNVPRGYLYFAICFSLLVETLNGIVARKKSSHSTNRSKYGRICS